MRIYRHSRSFDRRLLRRETLRVDDPSKDARAQLRRRTTCDRSLALWPSRMAGKTLPPLLLLLRSFLESWKERRDLGCTRRGRARSGTTWSTSATGTFLLGDSSRKCQRPASRVAPRSHKVSKVSKKSKRQSAARELCRTRRDEEDARRRDTFPRRRSSRRSSRSRERERERVQLLARVALALVPSRAHANL